MTDTLSRINTGKDAACTGTELRFSDNPLEPLTLVFGKRKIELTKTLYRFFWYVYDQYRTEGRTAFEYAELSEILTGDECARSNATFRYAVRLLTALIAKLGAPIALFYRQEVLYIGNQEELASHGNQAAIYALKQAEKVYEWHRISQERYEGQGWTAIARQELEQKKRDGIFPDGFTQNNVRVLAQKINRYVTKFRRKQNDKQLLFDFYRE